MSKLFGFGGDTDFCPGRPIYTRHNKKSSLFLSLDGHVDVYFPPHKRSRISAPYVLCGEGFEQKKRPSIEVLPDECLFEIFRRLPGDQERCASACVSKRWLSLVSDICREEICSNKEIKFPKGEGSVSGCEVKYEVEDQEVEGDGYLTRSLEGKKATDVRLAAIAVGTANRGGLGKLLIRGGNSTGKVTDVGLRAISRGCPSLRILSMWNLPSVGDKGLFEIANGCQMLEKLDVCHCPAITDKALLAIARSCPNLMDLTIESCPNICNEGLQAIGKCCPNLKSISIRDCPNVGDKGIAGLLSSATFVLTKVKLHGLSISDLSLAVIGHYCKAVTDLMLTCLPNVTERGFWVLGNGQGLQKLKSFTVTSCKGVTDIGLEAIGKGCPNMKQFSLRKCAFLSDNGLVSFAKAAMSLEILRLEECHRISQIGFFGTLLTCGSRLKALSLANCFGFKDQSLGMPQSSGCESLRSLAIRNCPGFGDTSLNILSKMCPQLQHLEFSGLEGITDAGLLPLIENSDAGLLKVNLSGCLNLTDKVVSSMTELHGWTLELLNLDGCRKVGDASLVSIAENCGLLSELDISKCAITDFGISALAGSNQLNLQILSLSGCSYVSDKSLSAFGKMGQTLSGLNLQHCKAISSSTIDFLVKKLLRCDILS